MGPDAVMVVEDASLDPRFANNPLLMLGRIAPMSISGGGGGADGKLYLSGHDLPELYIMQLPKGGGVLDHLDTIGMEAEGQAIDWDESQPGMLYGITRRTREILAMRLPLTR